MTAGPSPHLVVASRILWLGGLVALLTGAWTTPAGAAREAPAALAAPAAHEPGETESEPPAIEPTARRSTAPSSATPDPAAAPPIASQVPGRLLRLDDWYDLADVEDPTVSPDGGLVAFVRTRVLEEDNGRRREIWLAPADGSADPRRLTSPAFDSWAPRWSPDGGLLAFRSDRPTPGSEQDGDVWFLDMGADSGEAFRIDGVNGLPTFSPDGAWIAYVAPVPPTGEAARRTRSGRQETAYRREFEERVRERFSGRVYDWMNYRFDRRGYLPDPRDPLARPPRELWVVPAGGGVPRQLTRLGVDVQEAAWIGGDRLILVADEHQRDEHTYERPDLWRVDLDGSLERLTDDGFVYADVVVSPGNDRVAFRRWLGLDEVIAGGEARGAAVQLWSMPSSGGEMTRVAPGWDLRPRDLAWSPDGRLLLASADLRGRRHLFAVGASGEGAPRQITDGDRVLDDFHVSPGGRMAFVATGPTAPPAVHAADVDGGDEVPLTRFDELLLSQVRLGRTVSFEATAPDGNPVQSWIVLPPGYTADDGPWPLITAIHGGPHAAYGFRFSFRFQLWAAEGYAVLYTNPRGSVGYGEDFLWATWGAWGDDDGEDVLVAVDAAHRRWALDPDRQGVTGYSYGGFLTNWLITRTDRFAAAISGAGISNWISDYGTADIPRTKESEFFGPPWETRSAELLWRQSPLRYAGEVSTPTLFLHGEDDFRVPIEQGEQMYTALQKNRVPARFVRYPDTSHGGWAPWDTVHRMLMELEWWERWLDPGPPD